MTPRSETKAVNRKLRWVGLPGLTSFFASAVLGLCLTAGVAQGEGSADDFFICRLLTFMKV